MRLCLDVSSMPYGTGVSRYTANLARALVPLLGSQDQLTLFAGAFRQRPKLETSIRDLHLKTRLYPFPPKLTSVLFHRLNLPLALFTGSQDVFHAWDWYIPNPGNTKLVATVHDLALFKFPDTAHPEIRAHHEDCLIRLKRFHAHVIAVSQATKQDLIDQFAFPQSDITVIPEALPAESCLVPTKEQVSAVTTKFKLHKPYFLIVGTREPRKNHLKQIAAWMHFKAQFDLVVVGKPGWDGLEDTPGVIYTGYLSGPELSALYQNATLLMYASLYEGFGLPILEAFFHGTPVVTGNVSAMPEVAASAAALVDPQSSEDIVKGINTVLKNRAHYIAAGRERLKHFSWSHTARRTLALYRQLAGDSQ